MTDRVHFFLRKDYERPARIPSLRRGRRHRRGAPPPPDLTIEELFDCSRPCPQDRMRPAALPSTHNSADLGGCGCGDGGCGGCGSCEGSCGGSWGDAGSYSGAAFDAGNFNMAQSLAFDAMMGGLPGVSTGPGEWGSWGDWATQDASGNWVAHDLAGNMASQNQGFLGLTANDIGLAQTGGGDWGSSGGYFAGEGGTGLGTGAGTGQGAGYGAYGGYGRGGSDWGAVADVFGGSQGGGGCAYSGGGGCAFSGGRSDSGGRSGGTYFTGPGHSLGGQLSSGAALAGSRAESGRGPEGRAASDVAAASRSAYSVPTPPARPDAAPAAPDAEPAAPDASTTPTDSDVSNEPQTTDAPSSPSQSPGEGRGGIGSDYAASRGGSEDAPSGGGGGRADSGGGGRSSFGPESPSTHPDEISGPPQGWTTTQTYDQPFTSFQPSYDQQSDYGTNYGAGPPVSQVYDPGYAAPALSLNDVRSAVYGPSWAQVIQDISPFTNPAWVDNPLPSKAAENLSSWWSNIWSNPLSPQSYFWPGQAYDPVSTKPDAFLNSPVTQGAWSIIGPYLTQTSPNQLGDVQLSDAPTGQQPSVVEPQESLNQYVTQTPEVQQSLNEFITTSEQNYADALNAASALTQQSVMPQQSLNQFITDPAVGTLYGTLPSDVFAGARVMPVENTPLADLAQLPTDVFPGAPVMSVLNTPLADLGPYVADPEAQYGPGDFVSYPDYGYSQAYDMGTPQATADAAANAAPSAPQSAQDAAADAAAAAAAKGESPADQAAAAAAAAAKNGASQEEANAIGDAVYDAANAGAQRGADVIGINPAGKTAAPPGLLFEYLNSPEVRSFYQAYDPANMVSGAVQHAFHLQSEAPATTLGPIEGQRGPAQPSQPGQVQLNTPSLLESFTGTRAPQIDPPVRTAELAPAAPPEGFRGIVPPGTPNATLPPGSFPPAIEPGTPGAPPTYTASVPPTTQTAGYPPSDQPAPPVAPVDRPPSRPDDIPPIPVPVPEVPPGLLDDRGIPVEFAPGQRGFTTTGGLRSQYRDYQTGTRSWAPPAAPGRSAATRPPATPQERMEFDAWWTDVPTLPNGRPNTYYQDSGPSFAQGRPGVDWRTAEQAGLQPKFKTEDQSWKFLSAEIVEALNRAWDRMNDRERASFVLNSAYRPATRHDARTLGLSDFQSQESVYARGHSAAAGFPNGGRFPSGSPRSSTHGRGDGVDVIPGAARDWLQSHMNEVGLSPIPGDAPHSSLIGGRRSAPSAAEIADARARYYGATPAAPPVAGQPPAAPAGRPAQQDRGQRRSEAPSQFGPLQQLTNYLPSADQIGSLLSMLNPISTAEARAGRGPPQWENATPANPGFTFYGPGAGGKVEGGFKAAQPDKEGRTVGEGRAKGGMMHTLDDVRLGNSAYVTLASDPSRYGETINLGAITYTSPIDGKQYTIDNVQGYIHDTGGDFKGHPERIDIATGNFTGFRGASDFLARSSNKVLGTLGLDRGYDLAREAEMLPNVEARAEGGPVKKGKPYLVGERGPEVIVPDQSGTVVPFDWTNNRLAQDMVGSPGGLLDLMARGVLAQPNNWWASNPRLIEMGARRIEDRRDWPAGTDQPPPGWDWSIFRKRMKEQLYR